MCADEFLLPCLVAALFRTAERAVRQREGRPISAGERLERIARQLADDFADGSLGEGSSPPRNVRPPS